MKENKLLLIEQAKQALIDHDLYFLEYANGHFKVETIDFWATSGTWIDRDYDKRGKGLNTLLKYINSLIEGTV